MSDDSNIPTTVVEIPDIDNAMFRLRVAGKSCRSIARQLHVSENRVREVVEKMLTPVTHRTKVTELELVLERLDMFTASQHAAALSGNRDAIALSLRVDEFRADLLGLRAPAHVRLDPVQLIAQAQPRISSTDRIREALDFVRSQRTQPPAALTHDGGVNGSAPGVEVLMKQALADVRQAKELAANRDADGSPGNSLDGETDPVR